MEPKADQTGVVFGVQNGVPHNGGSTTSALERALCRALAQPVLVAARARRWKTFGLKVALGGWAR